MVARLRPSSAEHLPVTLETKGLESHSKGRWGQMNFFSDGPPRKRNVPLF